MKKFLVIGDPIDHSLSPQIHNYWFNFHNIDATYEKKKVIEEELQDVVSKIKTNKIFGANVTVPYKTKIIKYLDYLSDDARATQSVNTILKKEEKICGFNTDVDGFELSLSGLIDKIKNKTVFVLGAGGVAPSIVYILKKIKASKIIISNRTKVKSENLKSRFKDVETIEWGETPEADAVINVTSIGLNSSDKIKIDYEKIGHDKFFYDVIYKPSKTIFLKEAEKRGNKIINGKMMFVYQAQKAFELWNNLRPEINDKVLNILDG